MFEFSNDIFAAFRSKTESHPKPVLKIEVKEMTQPTNPARMEARLINNLVTTIKVYVSRRELRTSDRLNISVFTSVYLKSAN